MSSTHTKFHPLVPGASRIFVIYSITDPLAGLVIGELEARYNIKSSTSLEAPMPRNVALRDALAWADAAVAVLPSPQDRSRTNVIFETGMAVGIGLSVLLIPNHGGIPRDLAELPSLDPGSLHTIDAALAYTLERGSVLALDNSAAPASSGVIEHRYQRIASKAVDTRPGQSDFYHSTEKELINHVLTMVAAKGAKVSRGSRLANERVTNAPDLVVWDDALLPTFGLPVPFEIIRSTDRFPQLRSRLRHTLDATGARSLIAIAVTGQQNRRWSDGKSIILAVNADSFARALQALPLSQALSALLEGAEK